MVVSPSFRAKVNVLATTTSSTYKSPPLLTSSPTSFSLLTLFQLHGLLAIPYTFRRFVLIRILTRCNSLKYPHGSLSHILQVFVKCDFFIEVSLILLFKITNHLSHIPTLILHFITHYLIFFFLL